MPGILNHTSIYRDTNCLNVVEGQRVEYLGWVPGGPRFGSRGTVTLALKRKAVVNLGRGGVWNIPYHLLTIPKAA